MGIAEFPRKAGKASLLPGQKRDLADIPTLHKPDIHAALLQTNTKFLTQRTSFLSISCRISLLRDIMFSQVRHRHDGEGTP
jgi:hypothetical protein